MQRKSKYRQPVNVADENRRLQELEDVREELMGALLKYKNLLSDKVLLANKTEMEKKEMQSVLTAISNLASNLNEKNVGEGNMTVSVAALNAILVLHGQVNELRWRMHSLYNKVYSTSPDSPQPSEGDTPSEEEDAADTKGEG